MGIYESNVKEVGRLDRGLCPPDVVSAKRTRWQAISKASDHVGRHHFKPKPSIPPRPPWDQAMSMLLASVNLTALSVNRSAQWLHRGASLLHLQAELPDVLLTWSLQLAGKYAPLTPTNSTSLSSYRPCDGGVLLGKSNTNKTTTQLPLICWTTTGFSVRLWSTCTGNVCTHW